MMKLRSICLTLCLATCLVYAIDVRDVDCPYEICECYSSSINCFYRDLDILPLPRNETFEGKLWDLYLGGNNIESLSRESLPKNLSSLDLRDNPISKISRDAFNDSFNTLKVLEFSKANFTALPAALLSTSLESLLIEDTEILVWDLNILRHLGLSLKKLVLNNVAFKVWPDWINDFTFLQTLELRDISVVDIPDGALSHLILELEHLTIRGAYLSRIPKSIGVLQNLKSLVFTYNHLQYTNGLPQLSKLVTLDLGNNLISDVYQLVYSLHPYETSLTTLSLDHNDLKVIPHLDHMLKLSTVSLTGNQITDPDTGSLPLSITTLDVSHNQLPSIPSVVGSLPALTELTIFDNSITRICSIDIPVQLSVLTIFDNKITELNDNNFPVNSALRRLDLRYNPLTTISPLAFQNVAYLNTLLITNTKLTRMPVGLSVLTTLSRLDMNGNPMLVCTCSESKLAAWFQTRTDMDVSGSCGNTDISTFFLTLANQC